MLGRKYWCLIDWWLRWSRNYSESLRLLTFKEEIILPNGWSNDLIELLFWENIGHEVEISEVVSAFS